MTLLKIITWLLGTSAQDPTITPSTSPTFSPSHYPTLEPSTSPSSKPTVGATPTPSTSPTFSPSHYPTLEPSTSPSSKPTVGATPTPSTSPTFSPSHYPTLEPSTSPSSKPTVGATPSPTFKPSYTSNGSTGIVSNEFYKDLKDVYNPYWASLKETLDIGKNSPGPAHGSTIQVKHDVVETGIYAHREIPRPIALHVPTSSFIGPADFDKITRWYQEDHNTQVFRLFPGDDSVRNSRSNAPRSEAFGLVSWKRDSGWYEWSGRYTFVKVRPGAVLQIKHNSTYWSMQLILDENADGTYDLSYVKLRDRAAKTLLMTDVVGKSVNIKVLDDGENHKVYVEDQLLVENSMSDRPEQDKNRARWGLYTPRAAMDREILILVTGAYVGPEMVENEPPDDLLEYLTLSPGSSNEIPSWLDIDEEADPDIVSEWESNPRNEGYGFF